MQDYLLESLKLQRIDFFLKLVAASDCSEEEKLLAIQQKISQATLGALESELC